MDRGTDRPGRPQPYAACGAHRRPANRAGAETSRAREGPQAEAQVLASGFPAGPWARQLILPTSDSSSVNGDSDYRLGGLLRTQDIVVMREGARCLPSGTHSTDGIFFLLNPSTAFTFSPLPSPLALWSTPVQLPHFPEHLSGVLGPPCSYTLLPQPMAPSPCLPTPGKCQGLAQCHLLWKLPHPVPWAVSCSFSEPRISVNPAPSLLLVDDFKASAFLFWVCPPQQTSNHSLPRMVCPSLSPSPLQLLSADAC